MGTARAPRHRSPPSHPRFRAVSELGSGASATVWLAHDLFDDERPVALKVAHDRGRAAQLETEFRLLRDLRHSMVRRAIDFGRTDDDDHPFLALEYLEGPDLGSLARELRESRADEAFARFLPLFVQVTLGLDFLHRRGLLHLDLKPSNIICTEPFLRLVDLGIARRGDAASDARLGGTPGFRAPEARRAREADARSDLYSLGATFLHCLTGRAPIEAPEGLAALLPVDAPRDFQRLLRSLLEESPAHRPRCASDVAESLAEIGGQRRRSWPVPFEEPVFVGRSRQLASFCDWLEEVRSGGRPALLAVEGAAEMGKTRLAEVLQTELALSGTRTLVIAEHAVDEARPLERIVRRLLALLGEDRPDELEVLLSFLGIDELPVPAGVAGWTLSRLHDRVLGEAVRLVELAARGEPLVLIVEDLHLADALTVELLRRLSDTSSKRADRPDLRRLGVVITTRPGGHRLHERASDPPLLRLESLRPQDVERALEPLRARLPKGSVERIARLAGGVPGQIVRHAQLFLVEALGGRTGTVSKKRLPLAPTDEVEALRPKERRALLCLALAARPLDAQRVAQLVEAEDDETRDLLLDLERRGLVKASRAGHYPSQDLDVGRLTASYAPRTVERLHRRLAQDLSRHGDPGPAVARHLVLGGRPNEALDLVRGHAAEWRSLGRLQEAAEVFDELAGAARDGALRREVLELHGDTLLRAGRLTEAKSRFEELVEDGEIDPAARIRVLRKLGSAHQRSGENPAARSRYEDALALWESAPESDGSRDERLQLLEELATLDLFQGELDDALERCERGISMLDDDAEHEVSTERARENARHRLRLESIAGNVHLRRFEHDRAIERFRRGLDATDALPNDPARAVLLNNLALTYRQTCKLSQSLRLYGQAETIATDLADETALFSIQCNRAAVLARLGRLAEAHALLREIARQPVSTESSRARLFLGFTRALVEQLEGRDTRASWRESISLAEELEDPQFAQYGKLYLVENEIARGRWAQAARVLERLDPPTAAGDPLRRSVDCRRAWLSALLGETEKAARALPNLPPMPRAKDATLLHQDLRDAVTVAQVLAELGELEEAQSRALDLQARFDHFRESSGATECRLLLATVALRRGDVDTARGVLSELRNPEFVGREIVASEPRLPLLEACALLLEPGHDLARAVQLLDEARARLPKGSTTELGWLIDLVDDRAHGRRGKAARHRESARRFVRGLPPTARKAYERREHAARLGLADVAPPVSAAAGASVAARHLRLLSELRSAPSLGRALEAIRAGLNAPAVLALLGTEVISARGLDEERASALAVRVAKAVADGSARVESGHCVTVEGGDVSLWVATAGRSTEVESERLELLRLVALCARTVVERSLEERPGRSAGRGSETRTRTRSLPIREWLSSHSPRMRETLTLIERTRTTTLPVLLRGESGVGKDWMARWIHDLSPRRAGPFVAQSCTAVPADLFEADLFGYASGAFTGAQQAKPGFLLEADGGTFYLDGIDALPPSTQGKIARVLETSEFRPLGASTNVRVDIRFVASTALDLSELAQHGAFRKDLYFRFAGVEIEIPPLRERREDIPELLERFLEQLGGDRLRFDDDALRLLRSWSWPGNIRQLETLVRRLALTTDGPVTRADVARGLGIAETESYFPRWLFDEHGYDEVQAALRREYLLWLFDRCEGDFQRIAEELGTSKRNAYLRFSRAGIDVARLRRMPPS